jgi:prepilin-type processing-associated H-X9-DG protein
MLNSLGQALAERSPQMSARLPEDSDSSLDRAAQFRLWHVFALMAAIGVGIVLYSKLDAGAATVIMLSGSAVLFASRHGVLAAAKTVAGLFIMGMLWLMLMPASGYREPGPRAQCFNNLKNVVLALQNYESRYGVFPPAYVADANGRPMHSWRVLILPQLDRADLYRAYRFDEPWDGPNNSKLHGEMMPILCCPGDTPSQGKPHTSYVAVMGEHTAWPGARSTSTKMISSLDGSDRTILLVETHNSGIHWMEPRDTTLEWCLMGMDGPLGGSRPATHSNHRGTSVVGYVDGHVSALSNTLPAEALRELLTIDDGAPKEPPE